MKTILVLVFSYMFVYVFGQDCKVGGKTCADHSQCCGGCCFFGECVDTYRSCFTTPDVCDEHVCVGEEDCISYMPPECPGCEPIPLCRLP